MIIPAMRCAVAGDTGSRLDNKTAQYLHDRWLPGSGERMADQPLVFPYVNVGPAVQEHEAITDVDMPLLLELTMPIHMRSCLPYAS
jgi:AraC family transcriptional regulator